MKKFYISAILQLLKLLTSRDFLKEVEKVVRYYIDKNIENKEKKNRALGVLKSKSYGFASWMIDASIELVLGYLQIKYPYLFKGAKSGK